jgi:hypothetical protein
MFVSWCRTCDRSPRDPREKSGQAIDDAWHHHDMFGHDLQVLDAETWSIIKCVDASTPRYSW